MIWLDWNIPDYCQTAQSMQQGYIEAEKQDLLMCPDAMGQE